VLLLAALLVTPALLGLIMLMSWLEQRFTQHEVADEIADILAAESDPDRVDAAVARIASPLFGSSVLPRRG